MGLFGTRRALLGSGAPKGGLLVWDAADLLATTRALGADGQALTFTPAMAKRAVTVPAGGSLVAPLIQGKLDGTAGDVISYGRGTALYGSNAFDTMDPYQFTISFWYRPEYAGADARSHYILYYDGDLYLSKSGSNTLLLRYSGANYSAGVVSWSAGDWVHIAISIATQTKIDGTNYVRFTVNNAHVYTGTSAPTADIPAQTIYFGAAANSTGQATGIISDFHIFRRVLTDGDNGAYVPTPQGGSDDEIAGLYAAGVGAPAGSIVVDYPEQAMMGFPTNGTAEALSASDADEAVYAPLRADNKLIDWHCQTPYATSAWATVGTPAVGPADDAVNMLFGANAYTFDADADAEGISQQFGCTAGDDFSLSAWLKDDGSYALEVLVYDDDNSAAILTLNTAVSGAWENLTACFEAPAGCTHITVSVLSTNASQGACWVQQCVIYPNLWDDGGFETGTAQSSHGVPTTSEQSSEQSHTGTYSWKIVATNGIGFKQAFTTVAGTFYAVTAWLYATAGTAQVRDPSLTTRATSSGTGAWQRRVFIFRATAASSIIYFTSLNNSTFYVDDVSVVPMDALTLTCTPANEAASRESMTLTPWGTASTFRVGGRSTLTFPTAGPNILAAEGTWMSWVKFRHATAWASEYLLSTAGGEVGSFSLFRASGSNVLFVYYGNKNDASTATIADTNWHFVTLTWKAGTCLFYIDGVAAAGFALTGATIPTLGATAYLGTIGTSGFQADAAYLGNATSKKALSPSCVAALYALTRPFVLGDL